MPNLTLRTAPLALALACGATPDSDSSATDAPGTTTASTDPSTDASTSSPSTSDTPTTTTSSEPGTTTTTTSEPGTTTTTTTSEPGTTDTSTTGAPVGCGDLPLCEDFESVAADAPPDPSLWTVSSPNCSGTGTLGISSEQAHGGAHSLKVTGGGGYCDHVFIAHTAAIAELGPQVYGRFHVRLAAPLGDGHVTFVTMRDSADGGKDLRMGGQSKILMWNRESDDATLPSLSPAGIAQSLAIVPQQWTCVEFMIDQDAALLTTWVDGAEVSGLVVDAAPTPDLDQQWHNKADWKPVLEDIKFGWESYAGQTMTLHFDDIALAAARIGCE